MKLTSIVFKVLPRLERLVGMTYKHGSDIHKLEGQLTTLQSQTKKTEGELGRLKAEIARSYINRLSPQGGRISKEELSELTETWLRRFSYYGSIKDNKMLEYIAYRICAVEASCIGRAAGGLPNLIIRVLTARSIRSEHLEVLEVGTLFGCSVGAIYDVCVGNFKDIHLTVIDPFEGYYGQPLDPSTGISVTRKIFESNMRRLAIPESEYSVIQGWSYEEDVVKRASERVYDLLIIDGDHTYEGVKRDYRLFRPMVRVGGYIVFDDYQSVFPGIVGFIDEEVHKQPDVGLIGTGNTIAVFQVLASYKGGL